MLRSTADSKQSNNAGFTLVELIICVGILAVAAIPLMKSMSMSSRVNAKAQSIQNATSLGEAIMEEMKSSSIDQLRTKYGTDFTESGGDYQITISDKTATQGEKFDVTVDIKTTTYSGATELGSDKKANVLSANSVKLPKIEEIDTMAQAVLSSAKELNKYDSEALNYFNQKIADYPTHVATLHSKTIDIVKTDAPTYSDPGVKVTATVTYEDNASPTRNKYVKDIYAGTFIETERDGGGFVPIDSNIYIFYKTPTIDPTDPKLDIDEVHINVTDTSAYPAGTDFASHKVFFIRQDKSVTQGPLMMFNADASMTFSYADVGDLDDEGVKEFDNIKFVTNLDKNDITEEGHVYGKEAKNRVYDITVVLRKGTEEFATLNSTKSASDEP